MNNTNSVKRFLGFIECPGGDRHRALLEVAVLKHLVRMAGDAHFEQNAEIADAVQTISNWIYLGIALEEEWLDGHDAKDPLKRPTRLLQYRHFDEVHGVAQKESSAMTVRLGMRAGQSEGLDIKTVRQWDDGFRIVRLQSAAAMKSESQAMRHCGFQPQYIRSLSDKGRAHYSLRDPSNKPHATMDVEHGVLQQCCGKTNEPPIKTYLPYIYEFIMENKLSLGGEVQKIGIVLWQGAFHPIYNLPEGIVFKGPLDISELKSRIVFPKNTIITGGKLIINREGGVDYTHTNATLIETRHMLGDLPHCIDYPAITLRDRETNFVLCESWFSEGKAHRNHGPQLERWDLHTRNKVEEIWCVNNKIQRDDGPAHITWHPDGTLRSQKYYKAGFETKRIYALTPSPSYMATIVHGRGRSPSPG